MRVREGYVHDVGLDETVPHIYGPLNHAAVLGAARFTVRENGSFVLSDGV